jgi:hypothetical protein
LRIHGPGKRRNIWKNKEEEKEGKQVGGGQANNLWDEKRGR